MESKSHTRWEDCSRADGRSLRPRKNTSLATSSATATIPGTDPRHLKRHSQQEHATSTPLDSISVACFGGGISWFTAPGHIPLVEPERDSALEVILDLARLPTGSQPPNSPYHCLTREDKGGQENDHLQPTIWQWSSGLA